MRTPQGGDTPGRASGNHWALLPLCPPCVLMPLTLRFLGSREPYIVPYIVQVANFLVLRSLAWLWAMMWISDFCYTVDMWLSKLLTNSCWIMSLHGFGKGLLSSGHFRPAHGCPSDCLGLSEQTVLDSVQGLRTQLLTLGIVQLIPKSNCSRSHTQVSRNSPSLLLAFEGAALPATSCTHSLCCGPGQDPPWPGSWAVRRLLVLTPRPQETIPRSPQSESRTIPRVWLPRFTHGHLITCSMSW